MLDGQFVENGKPVISPVLVFYRTANRDIVISIVLVLRDAVHKPLNALGQKQKVQIGTLPHHLPAFRTPFIGVFNQKICGETQEYGLSRFDLV